MASVRIYSCRWVDFLHIVKARGDWGLFHVTWHDRRDQMDPLAMGPDRHHLRSGASNDLHTAVPL